MDSHILCSLAASNYTHTHTHRHTHTDTDTTVCGLHAIISKLYIPAGTIRLDCPCPCAPAAPAMAAAANGRWSCSGKGGAKIDR